MAAKLGLNAKLYRGAANATAATLMTNVRDLKMNDAKSDGDTSHRGNAFECTMGTITKLSIDFQMTADDSDADYAALQAAYIAMTPLAFKCISGAGGKGWDADWYIFKFERHEGLKDVTNVDVQLLPTYAGAAPRFPLWG